MSRPEDEHAVHREPHLRPEPKKADPSEIKAANKLHRESERARRSSRHQQSVFDEPDVFPGRANDIIDQDWSCSRCGYNLRGLPTHHPCPECGHKELYRPAPPDAASYQGWLRTRAKQTSLLRGWVGAVLAAILGGPWAIGAALTWGHPVITGAGGGMIVLATVFGPTMEEMMKLAAGACLVEVKPYLFRKKEQLQVATIGAALLFAVIENIIYLNVYIPNPSVELVIYRWTVCVAMHTGCTFVAAHGLVSVWERAVTELRPPQLSQGFRWLVIAIVLHGCYNAATLVVGMFL